MKKLYIIVAIIVLLLGITGFLVYRTVKSSFAPVVPQTAEESQEIIPQVDASVTVEVAASKSEANTVNLTVEGLDGKMSLLAYELTYDSNGLIKGVNSGSQPLDISGKDTFQKAVFLGTCSRNVCRADENVNTISVALEFTDTEGKKSQFTGDYTL